MDWRLARADEVRTRSNGLVVSRATAARTVHRTTETFAFEEFRNTTILRTVAVGDRVRGGDTLVEAAVVGRTIVTKSRAGATKRDEPRDASMRAPIHIQGTVVDIRRVKPEQKSSSSALEIDIEVEVPLAIGDILEIDDEDRVAFVVFAIEDLPDGIDALWDQPDGECSFTLSTSAIEALHARSIGPYSLTTTMPLGTKATFGGQRAGRKELAEAWRRHAIATCLEWTQKADVPTVRMELYEAIVVGHPRFEACIPESTHIFERELFALGISTDMANDTLAMDIATSEEIEDRSNGVVRSPETIDYDTMMPSRSGLFCEEIFGMVGSQERRTTFGHIELARPVLHPWFFEIAAEVLGIKRSQLKGVLNNEAVFDDEGEVHLDKECALDDTGAHAVRDRLADAQTEEAERLHAVGIDPSSFVFDRIPVLPPDLRPLVPLDNGMYATSDLNDLYRRVIQKNQRLLRLMELNAPEIIIKNECRLLQNDAAALFANGTYGPSIRFEKKKLVSLADLVRIRLRDLAEKRVDYSATATAIPDPTLAPDRCRIPRAMALELYRPFIFHELERAGVTRTIKESKIAIEEHWPEAINALCTVLSDRPVLLAPSRELEEDVEVDLFACEVDTWLESAVAVSPEVHKVLSTHRIAVHLPLTAEAVGEARTRLRFGVEPAPFLIEANGWLTDAIESDDPLGRLRDALLNGEEDPAHDPLACLVRGRPIPTEPDTGTPPQYEH